MKKQNKNKKTKAISNENESNNWFAHPNLDFAILINYAWWHYHTCPFSSKYLILLELLLKYPLGVSLSPESYITIMEIQYFWRNTYPLVHPQKHTVMTAIPPPEFYVDRVCWLKGLHQIQSVSWIFHYSLHFHIL